jgi:hypothetical protein
VNHVVWLFAQKDADMVLSEPETHFNLNHEIFDLNWTMCQAVKALSMQFDAVETAIDTIDDMEARKRLKAVDNAKSGNAVKRCAQTDSRDNSGGMSPLLAQF